MRRRPVASVAARGRDPDHLLRLHDELDDLTSFGLGWKSGSVLAVVVASIMLPVIHVAVEARLGLDFMVILLAAPGILTGVGVAKTMRIRSLRRAILQLEQESGEIDGESA